MDITDREVESLKHMLKTFDNVWISAIMKFENFSSKRR